jgi:hypothetical protein
MDDHEGRFLKDDPAALDVHEGGSGPQVDGDVAGEET